MAQQPVAARRPHGPQKLDGVAQIGLHALVKIRLVLHDAGQQQPPAALPGNLNGFQRPLVGVNAAQEQQVVVGLGHEAEIGHPQAVVHRGGVGQRGVAVSIADGYVGRRGRVFLVHRQNPGRRKPVDGGHHRRRNQPRVAERQEVEVVVDEVKLGRPLHQVADVQALEHLGVLGAVFLVAPRHHGGQRAHRHRIGGGE